MADSLLKGKQFYCREWAFAKIYHCLENRPTSKTCGALIMGGPGCGKTALCCETVWPTSNHGRQRSLARRVLAHHFCQAHDVATLSLSAFILGLARQMALSELLRGYREQLDEMARAVDAADCERDPDDAFKRCVLLPLLSIGAPAQNLFVVVDSIDESYLAPGSSGSGGGGGGGAGSPAGSRTIAELLASHHQLFPRWLLLVCSARRQSRAVTRMFTGFRKVALDDLRKTHVVRDAQQYILSRLDAEPALRRHLSRDTAEMLNQLHIKSNGCLLYVERVLDGVSRDLVALREVRDIPATLNGLYLWLCQRLFARARFARVRPLLNALLASRRPLSRAALLACARAHDAAVADDEFSRRLALLDGVLVVGPADTRILFHHSFAEWLLDVKHCTQRFLCAAREGHAMLAMSYSSAAADDDDDAAALTPADVRDFAVHLSRTTVAPPLMPYHLPLWMIREDNIRAMLEGGVDVNETDSNGRTLLANAAHQGNLQVTQLMLSHEADPEVADKNGQTALNLSARQGHTEVVCALIDTAIYNCEPQELVDLADGEGRTALRAASWGGHDDIVLSLVDYSANVNMVDKEGRTALIAAAYMGHTEIVETLLNSGADINLEDGDGRTALSVAALCVPASEGHASVVSLLLDRDAEVDHKDKDGMTPLLVAAYEGHHSVCELLLEGEADVDACDNNGRTPLFAAASMGHARVVSLLLFWGAAVDSIDSEGRTVLSLAALQ
ncbi:PREDICTED: ankyrin repeat domain-containing protein 50-like, partial [Priapulus caudatus]|uniref:Ankyrin repeat domain-containing protein 50-like n=1 Tax=Priapulus caudatus TaxID=37621 RepID=A0ABM1F1N7_PRICU